MQPSARIPSHRRRLVLPLLLCGSLATAGPPADAPSCAIPVKQDPRLDELRKADPDDPHINITADHADLGRTGETEVWGNVNVRMGQKLVIADQAQVDSTNRTITTTGRAEYLDPVIHVIGSNAKYSDAGGGSFEAAKFELVDGSGRGAAKEAQLINKTTLDLSGVHFTVCPPGNEDWVLRASTISLDQANSVGTGRDVELRFKGFPLLYTPWMSFPLNDQRKSGFLFPAIGNSSRSGLQLIVPWYWNIAPNYDATFTSHYFSQRGYRIDPEFRYLTEQSKGTVEIQYLPHDTQLDEARSFYSLNDVTNFADRTRATVTASYASDNSYLEDFGAGFEGTSIVFLPQLAELRNVTDHWSLLGRAQNYQVLDMALADDERPYALLPQVVAAGRWNDLPLGFSSGLDAEATNFYRQLGPQGIRIDAEPEVSWRTGQRSAYVQANAAWRYTTYSLHDTAPGTDDHVSRSLPVLSLDSGFVLERTAGSNGQRLQTLEPRALYLYVPYRNQNDIPIFDTAAPDLNMVTLFRTNRYVGADRVGDANQVAVGLTSRLLDAGGGHQLVSATLGEAYYFEQPRVTVPGETPSSRSTSDVVAELEVDAFKHWNARAGYEWDPSSLQTQRGALGLQYKVAGDSVLNASWRYQRDLLQQVDLSGAWPIANNMHAYGRWVYSISEHKALDEFIGLQYSTCCWAVRAITRHFVSSRTGQSSTTVGLELELKGLSSVGSASESFLQDAIRGYSALPSDAPSVKQH